MNNKESREPEQSNIHAPASDTATSEPETFGARARSAYLFHMWTEPRHGKKAVWRFRLEEVETGVRHGFGNMDALVRFLQERMAMK